MTHKTVFDFTWLSLGSRLKSHELEMSSHAPLSGFRKAVRETGMDANRKTRGQSSPGPQPNLSPSNGRSQRIPQAQYSLGAGWSCRVGQPPIPASTSGRIAKIRPVQLRISGPGGRRDVLSRQMDHGSRTTASCHQLRY